MPKLSFLLPCSLRTSSGAIPDSLPQFVKPNFHPSILRCHFSSLGSIPSGLFWYLSLRGTNDFSFSPCGCLWKKRLVLAFAALHSKLLIRRQLYHVPDSPPRHRRAVFMPALPTRFISAPRTPNDPKKRRIFDARLIHKKGVEAIGKTPRNRHRIATESIERRDQSILGPFLGYSSTCDIIGAMRIGNPSRQRSDFLNLSHVTRFVPTLAFLAATLAPRPAAGQCKRPLQRSARRPGAQAAVRPDALDFPSTRKRFRPLGRDLALHATLPARQRHRKSLGRQLRGAQESCF